MLVDLAVGKPFAHIVESQLSDWHLSSLTTCGSWEFSTTRSEWQLNTPEAHECYEAISRSFMVARNAAFTSPPGMGPRAVVQFMLDGRSTNPAATFVVGEPIAALPLGSEVATDFVGATRGTPPGVGAYQ
jgi:hypothetical protein